MTHTTTPTYRKIRNNASSRFGPQSGGIKVTLSKLVARTVMEVHWRAYQESVISSAFSRKSAPVGPASAMFYEIFTKRSSTRIFGKHETAELIREPGGWMALYDKPM